VLDVAAVSFIRDGRTILDRVDWTVRPGQHWVVLGRNGCGKTTLVRIAALYEHPTSGTVEVLGQRLGRCDVRALRRRVAYTSAAFVDLIRPELTPVEIVMCAINAALEPWWHQYSAEDRQRARLLLDRRGMAAVADRAFATLSSGERQRVMLARAEMNEPGIILLDEPNAGLDLGGREELVNELDRMAGPRGMSIPSPAQAQAPIVLVTHHVEEIPPSFTHVLALAGGRALGAGPIDDTLTAELLSDCFGLPLHLERRDGRFTAWRRA